jgi:hypothetical protein
MVRDHESNPSIRDVLLDEVNLRSYEKDQAQRLLVMALDEDSTYVGKLDTLMSLYAKDTLGYGQQVAYQLALSHHRTADITAMDAALSSDKRYDRLRELGALQVELHNDWASASASDLNQLRNLAWYTEPIGGAAAWGILFALGATDSLPNGILPFEYRSTLIGADKAGEKNDGAVMAYPNPAKDRLMITYPAVLLEGTLELLDARGSAIRSESLAAHPGFIELDVRSWSDGLYLARVVTDGVVVGETKFAVAR